MNEVEKIAEKIGHVIAYPFVHTAQFVAVLGEALKDEPGVKAAVIDLVKSAEGVVSDGGLDIASKGLDLTSDVKTIADVQVFFKLFMTEFLPIVEQAYKNIKPIVDPAAAA